MATRELTAANFDEVLNRSDRAFRVEGDRPALHVRGEPAKEACA